MDKPDVGPITGEPPAELLIEDITVGDGDEAKPGQYVDVHYVGVAFSSGKEFDASYNRGETFQFPLGGGQVIQGWDRGVAGMRVGGRRKLTIPPELAYGTAGNPPSIPPDARLVFEIKLVGGTF